MVLGCARGDGQAVAVQTVSHSMGSVAGGRWAMAMRMVMMIMVMMMMVMMMMMMRRRRRRTMMVLVFTMMLQAFPSR